MTRQEQNQHIIVALQDQLIDMPNPQQLINRSFTNWFQALLAAATPQMPQPLPEPANE